LSTTSIDLQLRLIGASHEVRPPIIALGSGITLAAVLNIMGKLGIPTYAACPEKDFVQDSRWFRPLPDGVKLDADNLPSALAALPFSSAVLLPCSDDWLRAVVNLPPGLAKRFPASAAGKVAETLIDKLKFSHLLDRLRIPHPRTCVVESIDQLDAIEDIDGAILKPLSSVEFSARYGVKGYLVESRTEARRLLHQLDLPILVQEFIPGPPTSGYFLDGFRDGKGQIRALFARRRIRMHPAKLGNSTYITSIPVEEVREAAFSLEYLLESVQYRGIFSAEFKFDFRDQAFKLIEINARPWWYVEFAANCGVDVCSMAYRDALELPVVPTTEYQIGRSCVFAVNDFRGWRASDRSTPLFSLVRSWLGADSTPFHWSDPGPVFRYIRSNIADFLRSRSDKRTSYPLGVNRLAEP
jgi:D-aspartate ligase